MTLIERRLLRLFRALPESKRSSLIDYAEFLMSREELEPESAPKAPLVIMRPEKESVVKAIKRLRDTYPMLDRAKLIHETSALMSQHLVQGRTAVEVINELEALFARHYQTMQDQQ